MSEGQGQGSGQGQGQGTGAGAGTGANGSGAGAGAGGQGGGDWRASLPAEYQNHAALKDYKDVGGMVKSHIELQSKFGSRKMQDMDAPADDAGKQAVFAKLGHTRPGKPEEYGLKFPDGYKGERNEAGLKDFTADAFEAGLTKQQAETIMAKNLKRAEAQEETAKQARTDALKRTEDIFRKEWGGEYDQNKANSEQAWRELIKDEKARAAMEQLGVNLNPDMVRAFSRFGKMNAEGYMFSGTGNGGGASGGLVEKQAELAKFEKENRQFLPGGTMANNGLDETVQSVQASWRKMLNQVADMEVAHEQKSA